MFQHPNETDWKGRALRAEAAMDVAARMVSNILDGVLLTERDWAVQRYLEIIEDYRLFRYGRAQPLTAELVFAELERRQLAHPGENGEGLTMAFELGLCYDCTLPIHGGPCISYESQYPHGR